MTQPAKKQSFLTGAAILALATAIVKVIGACYKIPLVRLIGNDGYSYFSNAYDIYAVLMTISTAGLPVAMSRMISESQTLGNTAQIKRIYRASLYVFLTIGIVSSAIMLGFSKQLAVAIGSPNSRYAIAVLAPAVLFVCLISSFRGYFQGQNNMVPTSVSQVIEAFCKLVLGLGGAWLIIRSTQDFTRNYSGALLGSAAPEEFSVRGNTALAAGGAIFGVSFGCMLATLYLWRVYRKSQSEIRSEGKVKPLRRTMRELLAIAIPITIGSAGLQLIGLVDTVVVLRRLTGAAGLSQQTADNLKGIHAACVTLFNLPSAFIVPLTVSVIPSVTSYLTVKNRRGALVIEESALRVMALIAMPCALGLISMSTPILQLLYGYSGESLAVATPILVLLGLSTVLNCLVLLTNAIMQAHGIVSIPVVHMLLGGVLKVIVNYILVGTPSINIIGAPIGTLACYLLITTLNIFAMRRMLPRCPKIFRNLRKPFVAAAVMGICAYASNALLLRVLNSYKIACLGGMVVAVAVYAGMVVLLRVVTMEDCMLLPKGDKIAKILRIH